MEFVSTMDGFQDSLLMARPRDVFGFAVRYFQDEKSSNPEEAHAVHMLPFLVFNNTQFKSALCTIFCAFTNTEGNYKSYMDSAMVCGVLQRMTLDALGLQVKAINELARARILTLKRIDYNILVSCIRFPLACYQIVIWLQDRLLSMLEEPYTGAGTVAGVSPTARGQQAAKKEDGKAGESNNSSSSRGNSTHVGYACLQQVPLRTIELHRVKQALQKEQQQGHAKSATRSTPSSIAANKYSSAYHKADHWSRHRSCAYHMHDCASSSVDADSTLRVGSGGGLALSEGELKLLTKLLSATVDGLIESGGPNVVTSEVFIEAFMSRYLKQLPSSS